MPTINNIQIPIPHNLSTNAFFICHQFTVAMLFYIQNLGIQIPFPVNNADVQNAIVNQNNARTFLGQNANNFTRINNVNQINAGNVVLFLAGNFIGVQGVGQALPKIDNPLLLTGITHSMICAASNGGLVLIGINNAGTFGMGFANPHYQEIMLNNLNFNAGNFHQSPNGNQTIVGVA